MAVALLAALMPAASLHMLSQKCCDRHRSWRLFMQAHVQDQSLSAEAAQYPVCFEPCLCMHACMHGLPEAMHVPQSCADLALCCGRP